MRDWARSTSGWLVLALGSAGCGPAVVVPSDDGTSTTAATSSSTEPPSGTTAGSGVDSTATGGSDADLCVQWCLNANARGCSPPFSGETCYTRCLETIEWAIEDGCEGEHREVLECEAQAGPPAELYCESLECEDAYKRHDLCRGSCSHLGGSPGSGGSQTTCEWIGSCYGHDFEVICPVEDAAGLCTCDVDGQVIEECEAGVAFVPLDCSDELHIFTTCCGEAFEGVLFP